MILFHSPADKGKSVSRNTGSSSVSGRVIQSTTLSADNSSKRKRDRSSTNSPSTKSAPSSASESDSSTFKRYRYGGVVRLNALVEYIQALNFGKLWRTAVLMQAVVDATSIQSEDDRLQVKPELNEKDLLFIQRVLNTNHYPACRPLLDLISGALKQGAPGIEAAHKTAALFLYFGCRIRPRTELLIGDSDETSLNRIELPDLCDRVVGIDFEIEPVPDPWQRYPEYGLGSSQGPPSQTGLKVKR